MMEIQTTPNTTRKRGEFQVFPWRDILNVLAISGRLHRTCDSLGARSDPIGGEAEIDLLNSVPWFIPVWSSFMSALRRLSSPPRSVHRVFLLCVFSRGVMKPPTQAGAAWWAKPVKSIRECARLRGGMARSRIIVPGFLEVWRRVDRTGNRKCQPLRGPLRSQPTGVWRTRSW